MKNAMEVDGSRWGGGGAYNEGNGCNAAQVTFFTHRHSNYCCSGWGDGEGGCNAMVEEEGSIKIFLFFFNFSDFLNMFVKF